MKNFFVGVKGVIQNQQKQILLLRNNGKGYWEFPGGRIDDEENLDEALLRELNEELPSIKNVEIGEILCAFRLPHNIKNNLGLVLIFYKVSAQFNLPITISDEHTEYRWVSVEEAISILDKNTSEMLKKCRAKLS